MRVEIVLGLITVGVTLSNARGLGLGGGLGGALNIGIPSDQSKEGAGYKHGGIGGELGAGVADGSFSGFSLSSSSVSSGGYGSSGQIATSNYDGSVASGIPFDLSKSGSASAGLGFRLELGLGGGNGNGYNKESSGAGEVEFSAVNRNNKNNAFGQPKGVLGLIGINGGISELSESSSSATVISENSKSHGSTLAGVSNSYGASIDAGRNSDFGNSYSVHNSKPSLASDNFGGNLSAGHRGGESADLANQGQSYNGSLSASASKINESAFSAGIESSISGQSSTQSVASSLSGTSYTAGHKVGYGSATLTPISSSGGALAGKYGRGHSSRFPAETGDYHAGTQKGAHSYENSPTWYSKSSSSNKTGYNTHESETTLTSENQVVGSAIKHKDHGIVRAADAVVSSSTGAIVGATRYGSSRLEGFNGSYESSHRTGHSTVAGSSSIGGSSNLIKIGGTSSIRSGINMGTSGLFSLSTLSGDSNGSKLSKYATENISLEGSKEIVANVGSHIAISGSDSGFGSKINNALSSSGSYGSHRARTLSAESSNILKVGASAGKNADINSIHGSIEARITGPDSKFYESSGSITTDRTTNAALGVGLDLSGLSSAELLLDSSNSFKSLSSSSKSKSTSAGTGSGLGLDIVAINCSPTPVLIAGSGGNTEIGIGLGISGLSSKLILNSSGLSESLSLSRATSPASVGAASDIGLGIGISHGTSYSTTPNEDAGSSNSADFSTKLLDFSRLSTDTGTNARVGVAVGLGLPELSSKKFMNSSSSVGYPSSKNNNFGASAGSGLNIGVDHGSFQSTNSNASTSTSSSLSTGFSSASGISPIKSFGYSSLSRGTGTNVGIGGVIGLSRSYFKGSVGLNSANSGTSAGIAAGFGLGIGVDHDTSYYSNANAGAGIRNSAGFSRESSSTTYDNENNSGFLSASPGGYGSSAFHSNSKGGYGSSSSSRYAAVGEPVDGANDLLSPGIIGHIDGIIGGVHNNVHGSIANYNGASSFGASNSHTASSTGILGSLGSLLSGHGTSSVSSQVPDTNSRGLLGELSGGSSMYDTSGSSSLGEYSSTHRRNYARNLNSQYSASAGSSATSERLSGGIGLILGL